MRLKWHKVQAVLGAILLVGGSARSLAQTGANPAMPSGVATAMPACPDRNPTASWTIRIAVPKGFGLFRPERHVKSDHHEFAGNDGADEDGGDDNDPAEKNPFHINIRALPDGGVKPGEKYARVRLILHDPDAHFYTWKDAGNNDVKGVGAGKYNVNNMLCGTLDIGAAGPKKKPVASFFIQLNPASTKPEIDAEFIFGVYRTGAEETVIFIDPKVKNNG